MDNITRLQRVLDYEFTAPDLLQQALTHRSVGRHNNERLEFLGDSILNHIIAQALYQQYPQATEGEMSRMRAALVKGETLAEVAREIQLGDYLSLGSGERKSGGHRRDSILADAFEAVVGAILLDGDVARCRSFVLSLFTPRLQQFDLGPAAKDPKTRLQEYLQGRGCPLPEYELLEVSGEPHEQQFTVVCRLRKPALAVQGGGGSRRKAEQDAASSALQGLTQSDE